MASDPRLDVLFGGAADGAVALATAVTLEEHGAVGDGGDDSDAIEAAILDACAKKVPIRLGPKFYGHSRTIFLRGSTPYSNDFKGIIGCGIQSSGFVCLSNNIRQIEIGWIEGNTQYFELIGFTAKFSNMQDESCTSAANIYTAGFVSFAKIDMLMIENGYRGFDSTGKNFFSCDISNIRIKNHFDDNIITASIGTGNRFGPIYVASPQRDRVNRMLTIAGQEQGFAAQINLEHSNVLTSALRINTSHGFNIDSINMEGLRAIDPSSFTGWVETSANNPEINTLVQVYCSVGGYAATSITRVGTTATMQLDPGNTKYGQAANDGGSGFRTGESIFISGSTQAEYNGEHVVTGYGLTNNVPWVTFDVAESAVTPATVAVGADYIGVWRGTSTAPSFPLVQSSGTAELLTINRVQFRSSRKFGATASLRAGMMRLHRTGGTSGGRLAIKTVAARGHAAVWDRDNPIIAAEISSATGTATFKYPHNLQKGDVIKVVGLSAGHLTATDGVKSVNRIVSRHTISYSTPGAANEALVATTGAFAVHQTIGAVATRSRTNNIASVTFGSPLPDFVEPYLRIRVYSITSTSFNSTSAVILDASGSTITYYNAGGDVTTTADTSMTVQVIENVIETAALQTPSSDWQSVSEYGQYLNPMFAVQTQSVAANTTIIVKVAGVIGARALIYAPDRVELLWGARVPDGITTQAFVSADDTVAVALRNTTAAAILLPLLIGQVRVVR